MATLGDYVIQAQGILTAASEEVQQLLSRIKADGLYPPFLDKICDTLQSLVDDGNYFWCTCGERTFAQQDALYQKGRNGDGGHIVTTVSAGQSAHNYAIACDFAYDLDPNTPGLQPSWDVKYLRLLADKAVENDLDAGLNWTSFTDGPHIQFGIRVKGISPRNQLLTAYKNGGKLAVFEYLDAQDW